MSFGNGPARLVWIVSLLRFLGAVDEVTREELTITEIQHQHGSLPQLNLSTVQFHQTGDSCSACVRVCVRMRTADLNKTLAISYQKQSTGERKNINIATRTINNGSENSLKLKWTYPYGSHSRRRKRIKHPNPLDVWELVYDCFRAEAGTDVSVSLTSNPMEWVVNYTVNDVCPDSDPVPRYKVSVDELSRTFTVTVEKHRVKARLCYRKTDTVCSKLSGLSIVDPFQSVTLNFPYLLPCVCVEVYHTHRDALRDKKCPFVNSSLGGGNDVWRSSEVTLYGETGSSLAWSSPCPVAYLKPSASLCWRNQRNTSHCTHILNSTLEEVVESKDVKYNVSAVDKHPQMCVQFSFKGSKNVYCPFQPGLSKWEVYVSRRSQSLRVHLTTTIPASFSAQLCVQEEIGCVPRGRIQSVTDIREAQLTLPLASPAEGLCVQVWRSKPAQSGMRVLCPDYSHRRWGLFGVAALALLATVAMVGSLVYHVTKKGFAGWLFIQRPVLLVCSSEKSAHVSAVCALASVLQGELCAAVRMALWAQSSAGGQAGGRPGPGAGPGAGVADLGPLPWLYGQWEVVQQAGGKVLIAWSLEANESYKSWGEEMKGAERREKKSGGERKGDEAKPGERVGEEERGGTERMRGESEEAGSKTGEGWKQGGSRAGEWKEEKGGRGEQGSSGLSGEGTQMEPSSVTGPVFRAALSCLQGALQGGGRGHGFALVYFQGLCHSRDIPKELRGLPRYCLPRDFGGLIRELGGTAAGRKNATSGWRCWPRLLSKALSLWLARRLTHRFGAWLPPQTTQAHSQEKEGTRPKPSQDVTSHRTPPTPTSERWTEKEKEPQEKEPLSGSPWR